MTLLTPEIIEKAARALPVKGSACSYADVPCEKRCSCVAEAKRVLLAVLPDICEAIAKVADARGATFGRVVDAKERDDDQRRLLNQAAVVLKDFATEVRGLPSPTGEKT